MKAVLFTIAIFIFCKSSMSQSNINFLKIRSVPIDLSTPYKVNCGFFETAFEGEYTEKIIRDKKDLAMMFSLIKNVVYLKNDFNLDARVKIYINFEKSTKKTIVCLSSNDIITINGKLIKTNQQLEDLIKKLM